MYLPACGDEFFGLQRGFAGLRRGFAGLRRSLMGLQRGLMDGSACMELFVGRGRPVCGDSSAEEMREGNLHLGRGTGEW